MDDGRAGDAAISPLDEALIGGKGASPSDGAAGGPGQDQAGETSGGMKELSEQPSVSQTAESSHGPAENAELYKDLYLKPYLRELFNGFLGVGNLEGQIQNAINNALAKKGDNTSRSGNILILGGHGCGKTTIATGLARAIAQEQGSQFVKMARIYATDLNRKDLPSTLAKIAGGILIVEEAGDLDDMTAEKLTTAMEFRTEGLIIVMEDEQKYIQDMLKRHPRLTMKFTSQIFIPAFTPDELVGFASIYADDEGYSLSEGAKAALAGRISSLMNESEPISITRMHELVDGGIRKANVLSRKLFGGRKRFDEEGRIIIQDKDV